MELCEDSQGNIKTSPKPHKVTLCHQRSHGMKAASEILSCSLKPMYPRPRVFEFARLSTICQCTAFYIGIAAGCGGPGVGHMVKVEM